MRGTLEEKNKWLISLKGARWARNTAGNREIYRKRGKSIEILFHCLRDKSLLLTGPGPSLDLVAPMLGHTYERMPVMACNSALNPLAGHGIAPDIIVVLDAEPKIADQIKEFVAFVPEESRKDSALVMSAMADPEVARAWPHALYYYGQEEGTSEASSLYWKALLDGWAESDDDKQPVATLANSSCVFVTMIQLAFRMGAIPIYSAGFELPVRPGASYAAVRYDLSANPPKPTAEQIRQVDAQIIAAHRQYIGSLLDTLTVFGAGFVNLSPFASFRDNVMTLPPITLMTGEMRVSTETAKMLKEEAADGTG